MKRVLSFSFLFVIGFYLADSVAREGNMTVVEGIFYLDGLPISIEIEDGKISRLVRKPASDETSSQFHIGPGLIDNQVNGYVSVGFSSIGLTVEQIRKATRALWQAGVTTYLPTLITATHEILLQNFSVFAQACQDSEIAQSIPGYHLEGPYISPDDGYRGAHNRDWVRLPDWQEFLELDKAAGNRILQVTIAPELDGAMEFLRNCIKAGKVVAIGHHNAPAAIIKQAIDEGASIATHLGNGCANLINRHDNPLWPQLADDRLMASIIVDGFHLRPEEVQVFYKAKGSDRTILVSDVVKLAGMPPGAYTYDGRSVVLTPEGVVQLPSQNVLAGAASPLRKCVGNFMRFTQCSLAEAIHAASRNPARLTNLNDRGEIETGKRADLILFSMEDGVMSIKKTILAGREVYSAE